MTIRRLPSLSALLVLALAPFIMGTRGCRSHGGMSCDQRLEAATAHVESVLAAHLACSSDADCVTVNISTDCQGRCPQAVAAGGLEDAQEAIAQADRSWCAGYIEDGCGYATPSCVYLVPACDAGACVLKEPVSRAAPAP